MMGTFLSILKIVGIVLLCILAFIITLLLLILFVPYRYRVHGEKKEGIAAYAKVTWLLHFVVVLLTYDDGINLRIKILGIPFYDKKKKAEKARLKEEKERRKELEKARKEKEKAKKRGDDQAKDAENGPADKTDEPDVKDTAAESNIASDTDREKDTEEKSEEPSEDTKKKKSFKDIFKKRKKKQSFLEWLEEMADKTSDLLFDLPDMIEDGGDALFEKLEGIKKKITDIYDKIDYYHRLLTSEGAEWVYEYVKKHVIGILKAVRPTRFDAEVNIADEDPGSVAKVYEYQVYALPFIELIRGKRGKVCVNAYQDEKYFDFEADLRGRALLFAIAWHGALILFNKKVKYFIKRLKREEEAEENKNG